MSGVTDVGVSYYFGIALTRSGNLYAWGEENEYGELGTGDTFDLMPEQLTFPTNVKAISVGFEHCMALTTSGTLYSWGRNNYGQLGTGDTDDRTSPAKVKDLSDVVSMCCGAFQSAAVTADGSLYTWGCNGSGQLGLGDAQTEETTEPQKVEGLPALCCVMAEGDHTAVISSEGTLYICGFQFYADSDGTTVNDYVFEPKNTLFQFPLVNTYDVSRFGDVSVSDWFCPSVASACQYGLMMGSGNGVFSPSSSITIAESVALASRIHRIYTTGEDDLVQGSPWYQTYANYALYAGILASDDWDYSKTATRAEFAEILAGALPDGGLGVINRVDDEMIPDVPADASYYSAVYKLYRAGVLTGNESAGTFAPDSTIDRSSVAAIVSRMADLSLRKSISLIAPVSVASVTLNRTSASLETGQTVTLYATVLPDDATDKTITWSSSDTSVATVSNGKITATDGGTAVITAFRVKRRCGNLYRNGCLHPGHSDQPEPHQLCPCGRSSHDH